VRRDVETSLRRSGYLEEGADERALLDALSTFIRSENFEEREQERGYLDRAVLHYMKGKP
ncbi:MAG TPA: putative peptidoglycan binding domain-containing protein, partial [Rubrobacteraceae bacterium]|nr:putative peptidoglycan binding domain-containing protein [Rubrobacteraceae bacterium]